MKRHRRSLSCIALASLLWALVSGYPAFAQPTQPAKPGNRVDYEPFFPGLWRAKLVSTRLIPWEGKNVVLLTTTADGLDGKVMATFLDRLDAGWALYAKLTGQTPQANKRLNGKPTIAAIPDGSLSCGYGCGNVGTTGIEVAGFYDGGGDYRVVAKDATAFPHYYFYEMGRNYYTFGDRHSQFTTGYAVFMRYVCMDALKCTDLDSKTRDAIVAAEAKLAKTDMSFIKAFTTVGGLDEKTPRLKDLNPSDQPVIYASAMLKLRKDYGGDDWVQRFYAALAQCPPIKAPDEPGALGQSVEWLVAASCAAKQDLSPVFCDRWRLPLGPGSRAALKGIDWKREDLSPAIVLQAMPKAELPAPLGALGPEFSERKGGGNGQ